MVASFDYGKQTFNSEPNFNVAPFQLCLYSLTNMFADNIHFKMNYINDSKAF